MLIKYELAEDLQEQVNEISKLLFPHVKLDSVVCLRSYGSSSRGTVARCHALGKAMQLALGRKGFYVIEVISKRFDKMSETDKTKTLIHELMHIPKSFGGGFIHHNIVHERNVEMMFQKYINLKKKESFVDSIMQSKKQTLLARPHQNLDTKQKVLEMHGDGIDKAREVSERVELSNLKKKWWF